jgi:hypothetical protein
MNESYLVILRTFYFDVEAENVSSSGSHIVHPLTRIAHLYVDWGNQKHIQ